MKLVKLKKGESVEYVGVDPDIPSIGGHKKRQTHAHWSSLGWVVLWIGVGVVIWSLILRWTAL